MAIKNVGRIEKNSKVRQKIIPRTANMDIITVGLRVEGSGRDGDGLTINGIYSVLTDIGINMTSNRHGSLNTNVSNLNEKIGVLTIDRLDGKATGANVKVFNKVPKEGEISAVGVQENISGETSIVHSVRDV